MTNVHFISANIAVKKAEFDQCDLLDRLADSHELMARASRLVADDTIKTLPELRDLLGRAADWMRLFEQTIDMLDRELSKAA